MFLNVQLCTFLSCFPQLYFLTTFSWIVWVLFGIWRTVLSVLMQLLKVHLCNGPLYETFHVIHTFLQWLYFQIPTISVIISFCVNKQPVLYRWSQKMELNSKSQNSICGWMFCDTKCCELPSLCGPLLLQFLLTFPEKRPSSGLHAYGTKDQSRVNRVNDSENVA